MGTAVRTGTVQKPDSCKLDGGEIRILNLNLATAVVVGRWPHLPGPAAAQLTAPITPEILNLNLN